MGATIRVDQVPVSDIFLKGCEQIGLDATDPHALEWVLAGGDDYQLCFTVPKGRVQALEQLDRFSVPRTEIGFVQALPDLRCVAADGSVMDIPVTGYQHFS